MNDLILNLCRGNYDELEKLYSNTCRQATAFEKMEELTGQIRARLSEEFHPLLREYEDNMMDAMDAACEESFLAGYRLGVRLMLAAWPEENA